MKNLFLGVLSLVLLTTCASRKMNRDKSTHDAETVVQNDVAIESTAVKVTDANLWESKRKWTFEPIDPNKPSFVNGQKLENAKATSEETETKKDSKTTETTKKVKTDKGKTVNKVKDKANKKTTDREGQSMLIYYLLGVAIVLGVINLGGSLWRYWRRINPIV